MIIINYDMIILYHVPYNCYYTRLLCFSSELFLST